MACGGQGVKLAGLNGTRPASVHDLHLDAQHDARRDGKPRWVVTTGRKTRVILARDYVFEWGADSHPRHVIERVAYPEIWHYEGRYRRD